MISWPGSAVHTRFSGTSLAIRLAELGANHYEVVVDGVVRPVLQTATGDDVYTVVSGLAAGAHDAVITRRTESLWGATELLGFPGATLLLSEDPPGRRVELLGDSLTTGYGVLGADAFCPFELATQAETHAWGALASSQLGVLHTAIAYSGKGAYRNYDNTTTDTLPAIWDRVLADYETSLWDFHVRPDLVVLTLGGNDFAGGDPGQSYVDAMTAFVGQIRARYPGVAVVLATNPMFTAGDHTLQLGYLQSVATAAGAGVTVLDLPLREEADGYGCDYHPSEATQGKMATALVNHVLALPGW